MSSSSSAGVAEGARLFRYVTFVMQGLGLIEFSHQINIRNERDHITEIVRAENFLHLITDDQAFRESAADFAEWLDGIGYKVTVVPIAASHSPRVHPREAPTTGRAIRHSDLIQVRQDGDPRTYNTGQRPHYGQTLLPPTQRRWPGPRSTISRPVSRLSTTSNSGIHNYHSGTISRTQSPANHTVRWSENGEVHNRGYEEAAQELRINRYLYPSPGPQHGYAPYESDGRAMVAFPSAFPTAPANVANQGPAHLGIEPHNAGPHYRVAPGLPPIEAARFGIPPPPPRHSQGLNISSGSQGYSAEEESTGGIVEDDEAPSRRPQSKWQRRQEKKELERKSREDFKGDHIIHTNWNLGEKDEILKKLGLWVKEGEEHLNEDLTVKEFSQENRIAQRTDAKDLHSMISKAANSALDAHYGPAVREEYRLIQRNTWPKALFNSHSRHKRPALREAIAWHEASKNGKAPKVRPSARVAQESQQRQEEAGFVPGQKKRKRVPDAEASGSMPEHPSKKRKSESPPAHPTTTVDPVANESLRLRLVGSDRPEEDVGEGEVLVDEPAMGGDTIEEAVGEEYVEEDEIVRQLNQLENDRE